jgi:uncharacterized membrane protein YhhN
VSAPVATGFAVAAVFALVTWAGVWTGRKPLEYVGKPLTMLALAAAVALSQPPGEYAHWLIAGGLLLGGVGDTLLMLADGVSNGGLSAFLAGHIAYILGFTARRQNLVALAIAGVLCAVVILVYQRWIVRGLRASEREHLIAPVALYMVVIGAMTAAACATLNPLAAAGAILFFASDGLFAWYHFVGPLRWGRPLNIVLYQCGQALIAVSMATAAA